MSDLSESETSCSSECTEVFYKDIYSPRLWNEDLAPLTVRTWGVYSMFAFWMTDVHSVGGYTTSGSLFMMGISCWQVMLAHLVGILFVMALCNLSAKPSVVTGTPFPVMARMAFGVYGANIPACIRGIQSIPYYGINTWLASNSLVIPILKIFPGLEPYADDTNFAFLGLSAVGWGSFAFMWVLQALLFMRGIDSIRNFIDLAGPAVYVVMVAMTIWLLVKAGGVSFEIDPKYMKEPKEGVESVLATVGATATITAFFAGPMLNFGDFSRYCTSYAVLKRGNLLGCPLNFLFFAVLVVLSTAATPKVFGEIIDDPVKIVSKMDNFWVSVVGALTFSISTMGLNIIANFLSPCFDFSNAAPEYISMNMGGAIAAVGSIFCLPWKLYGNSDVIHSTLGALGSFIGPLMGIYLAEFYVVSKQHVELDDLFILGPKGKYWYKNGFNPAGLGALVPSVVFPLCCVLLPSLKALNDYAYFIGTGMGFSLYILFSWGRLGAVKGRTTSNEPLY